MNKVLASVVGSSVIAVGLVATPVLEAQAATFACSPTIAGKVTGTTGCEVSDTANQDFLNTNPITVNAEGFFGITDWVFSTKIADNISGPAAQSGNWDISSIFQNTWQDVMLVFKNGNGTFITGYKVQSGVTSGTWNSPFVGTNPQGNPQIKDVSHISLYYTVGQTTDPKPVPEPGTAGALGLFAIGGLSFLKKKGSVNA